MAVKNFSSSTLLTNSQRRTFWDQVSYGAIFAGGNQSVTDLYTLANSMALKAPTAPTAGGTLTVNSVSLGSYDYAIRNAETVTFSESNYFTSTEDTRSAFVVWNGNCTISAGTVFKPVKRKLFTVLFIKGNLTLNGEISMSQRGANHSGTGNSGGSTTAGNVLIYSGTHGGVTNPQIPSAGGAGGSDAVGTAGTSGGTGGGGSGNNGEGVGTYGRAGVAGTAFTGGSGSSGECCNSAATAPVTNGGKGGIPGAGGSDGVGGGAGNPGGEGKNGSYSAGAGSDGTGGVLIIFVTGTISGSGTITAAGAAGGFASGSGNAYTRPGGGSGGGSVTVLYGSDSSSITPTASGGAGGSSAGGGGTISGFAGGAGTARKLAI